MPSIALPSHDVPEHEKRAFSEAEVHSRLFAPDMEALGYPRRTNSQADGEYFQEQRSLALRRLSTRRTRGQYDGLYLIGNTPVVLCELKRYDALDGPGAFEAAKRQLFDYAASDDFKVPPPFLVLYTGKVGRNAFYRRRQVADPTTLGELDYEELDEIWSWERIRSAHLFGEFEQEEVDEARLREILLYHLDRIEEDMDAHVTHAVAIIEAGDQRPPLTQFGRWLVDRPQALRRMRMLYQRKRAELAKPTTQRIVGEMTTQAAINYLNKVFFLSLCEDRHLAGFYRILREFLPSTRTTTSPTTATVFMGLLRRRILDTEGGWNAADERSYRDLRGELAEDIRSRVIEQNSWFELIRVAFDLAEETFPVIYREDAFDYFRPQKETVAELVYDLSTKSYRRLTNHAVGDIYQALLASRRSGQRRQAKLGAFYTPKADVDYMVSRLALKRGDRVLDPCMGSGHFLEGAFEHLFELHRREGHDAADAFRQVVGEQIYGADIDTFAASLSAIRMFLLDDADTRARPHLYIHDMLLHSPERPDAALFAPEGSEAAVALDPEVDALGGIDEIKFDAVVGNPPYGAERPAYKRTAYAARFGTRQRDLDAGSAGTGDGDTYGMFIANGIERLRDGGRLCFITNDSFRSLTTFARLRRFILDRCKIVEILLTDTKHFGGVSFQFAGMSIMTLEKCSDAGARQSHRMRLVDYVRDPADFAAPPADRVTELGQSTYELFDETPFFVGVPSEVVESARNSHLVRDIARGRQGLATADDRFFLAAVGTPSAGLTRACTVTDLATEVTDAERLEGIDPSRPHFVPFAKGEGFGEYWRPSSIAIDWSRESVAELHRRDHLQAGSPRRPRFQNRDYYFKAGLTYSVVSSGRLSVRILPEGHIFGHKGSAIFVEDEGTTERFLLGYLNSRLATYFMKRIVNTTATADIGYVEKLPYRAPDPETETYVGERVARIIELLKTDADADIAALRDEIDERILDLFEIRAARDTVWRFYDTVGRVEAAGIEDPGATP